jgi:CheY-like chemotaxis protein
LWLDEEPPYADVMSKQTQAYMLILQICHQETAFAENGLEAVNMVKEAIERFDVILMD